MSVVSAHGLRSITSTYLNEQASEQNFNPDAIEVCLAHNIKGNDVRKAYLRSNFYNERIRIMQFWSDTIEKIIK